MIFRWLDNNQGGSVERVVPRLKGEGEDVLHDNIRNVNVNKVIYFYKKGKLVEKEMLIWFVPVLESGPLNSDSLFLHH